MTTDGDSRTDAVCLTAGDQAGTAWPFATAAISGGTVYADESLSQPVTSVQVGADAYCRFWPGGAGTYTVTFTNPANGATAVVTVVVS